MKTKGYSHQELAHIWAQQLPEHKDLILRSSSMIAEGPKIYSYGHHYMIAQYLTSTNGETVVFFNSNKSSVTTEGKHKNPVRSAIPTYLGGTVDEYEIQGNYGYGYGYECVTTKETRKAAKEQIKCYRENEPGTPFRIVKKRVKLTNQ